MNQIDDEYDYYVPKREDDEHSSYIKQRPVFQPPQRPEAPPHMIDRNLVILIFIVFVAGLLLGKVMNPVVLRHS